MADEIILKKINIKIQINIVFGEKSKPTGFYYNSESYKQISIKFDTMYN